MDPGNIKHNDITNSINYLNSLIGIYFILLFRADIIETQPTSRTGFLATDDREYAEIIANIIHMSADQRSTIKHAARASVSRFSGEQFEEEFLRATEPFFRNAKQ